jgi:predicted MPP superfamily phosphohydrolase
LQAAALSRGVFPAYKTNHPKPSYIKQIIFTLCDLHYLLAYTSPEIIKHITKTSANITIDILVLCLVTLEYKIYTISKAIVVISRITDSKNPTNNKLFDKID